MNWFKSAINIGWQDQGLYHFINIMKLQIDDHPDLSLSEGGISQPDKIGFNILKDNGNEYSFVIGINGNNIDTMIYAKPARHIDMSSFDAYKIEPREIIANGLVKIDNDYGGEIENGMV